jgi:hypothetical protein
LYSQPKKPRFHTSAKPSPPPCLAAPFSKQKLSPVGSAAAGVGWSKTRQRSRKCSCAAERSFSSTLRHLAMNSAWVTLFSLLASWALLSFLQRGGWPKLVWTLLGIAGATMSKGPGLFHALMMTGAVGLAFMTPELWRMVRRKVWWLVAVALAGVTVLWLGGLLPYLWGATSMWQQPRFIGHAYTLTRVFWEFAWRAVVPVSLSADHHIAETLIPPGAEFWSIPDTGAMWAAAAMLALTAFSIWLAWRRSTRLVGVCLFLFTATMLFRVLYLIPEFMPEYRIYPGMPWFCLGAAIVLAAAWRHVFPGTSPRNAAVLLVGVFALMSMKRSFLWHDLDRLMADVLRQYPAQGRAIWELHGRDAHLGDWRRIIDRQRTEWPPLFQRFLEENRRLAPARELPTGHFALADEAANEARGLAIDAVHACSSGHLGLPLGCRRNRRRPLRRKRLVRAAPRRPEMAQPRPLHPLRRPRLDVPLRLAAPSGYDVSMDDVKNFRQLHSITPGHPGVS